MMDEKVLQRAYDLGFEFEKQYHGCAQCVIGGVYQLFPEIKSEDIFRSANALAGGTGLTAEGQCGAVSGACMILSQLYGRSFGAIEDPEKKRFVAYRLGAEFIKRFKSKFGSVTCGDVQTKLMGRSFDLLKPEDWEAFEKAGGHERECPSVVGAATRMVVELMLEERAKRDQE